MDGRWKSYTEYSATNLASPFKSTQNLPYGKFPENLIFKIVSFFEFVCNEDCLDLGHCMAEENKYCMDTTHRSSRTTCPDEIGP